FGDDLRSENSRSDQGSSPAGSSGPGEVAGMVPLGGKPEAAVADGQGHIFVNNEDKTLLVEFDSKALKVLNNWPIEGCDSPSGLAIDTAHKRLFSGCHNQQMVVVDYTTGKCV